MAPSRTQRQQIAQDTISRSVEITSSTPTASLFSTFISSQRPPLLSSSPSFPSHPRSKIRVINADTFTAARNLMDEFGVENTKGRTAVLNLASDEIVAGGWLASLCTTQEEALCYSSTLYSTLKPSYYPWPNLGPDSIAGIYSPAVVIFKHDLDNNCTELPIHERRVVGVITVAAPRGPKTTINWVEERVFAKDSDLEDLRAKIRLVYRMAGANGIEYLVLGAMGCGAYRCPPKQVAREMKAILLEDEFKGWFRQVVFAIYSTNVNGPGNFRVFESAFDGVEV